MNENHTKLCGSPEWAEHLHTELLPSVVSGIDLGADLLEVGPGPGAATEWLRTRVRRLVAVEHDKHAADALAARYLGTNVEAVHGDATALTFPAASFDSVASFTMLHHIPTPALQDRLLAGVLRVLRPGGVLVGSDCLPSAELRDFHEGDTYNPIDSATFLTRLRTLGFCDVAITVDFSIKFVAYKPRTAARIYGTNREKATIQPIQRRAVSA
jgi:SAM-dependent methyltransferase